MGLSAPRLCSAYNAIHPIVSNEEAVMADTRKKAVATAEAYDQGNIAGLDAAMTRRLIASTVMTESHGGDLAVTNRQGYVGRYQAGADWLADAGYVDADKLKTSMAGYRNEWAWAQAGEMARFLESPSNWKNGLSLDTYKASDDLQDRAFKTNCDKTCQRAVKDGVLHADDTPEKIAGFLKVQHISGYGGAVAAATGGRVSRDSNGTSNYDYMHDITRNRDGLNAYMSRGEKTHTQADATYKQLITSPDYPDKKLHDMYRQAVSNLEQLGPSGGFKSRQQLENAAAAVAVDARATGLSEINHISKTTGPSGQVFLVAVQGNPASAASKNAYIDYTQAVNQTVEQSTKMAQPPQQTALAQKPSSEEAPALDSAVRGKTA